jgi:signal transduction histidine kinase
MHQIRWYRTALNLGIWMILTSLAGYIQAQVNDPSIPNSMRLADPLILKADLTNYRVDSFAQIWIYHHHTSTIQSALQALASSQFVDHSIASFPNKAVSGHYDFWILIPLRLMDSVTFPLAITGYGIGNDSVWTLNAELKPIQGYHIPGSNKIEDYTGYINSVDFTGIGLVIDPEDRYILFKIKNYRYGSWDLPRLFDARIYESYYYKFHKSTLVLFWFYTGLAVALLLYFLIQFIKIKNYFFIWCIFLNFAIYLPLLDQLAWIFSGILEIPDLWVYTKVSSIILKWLSYILIIENLLAEKASVLQWIRKYLFIFSGIFFLIDLGLLGRGLIPESLWLFFRLRELSLLFYILLFYFILPLKGPVPLIVRFGIVTFFVADLYELLSDSQLAEAIQLIGGILQLFIFGFALSHKAKEKEMQAQHIESENKKLIEENLAMNDKIRKELARDIHDEVGSTIAKLSLGLQWVRTNQADSRVNLNGVIDQVIKDLRIVSDQVKELVFDMHSESVQAHELQSQIRSLANNFLEKTLIKVDFSMPDQNGQLMVPIEVKKQLMAITKECIHNIIKHSRADTVWIKLQVDPDHHFLFSIKDNGVGIIEDRPRIGTGLKSISQRALAIQAEAFFIQDQGLEVRITGSMNMASNPNTPSVSTKQFVQ